MSSIMMTPRNNDDGVFAPPRLAEYLLREADKYPSLGLSVFRIPSAAAQTRCTTEQLAEHKSARLHRLFSLGEWTKLQNFILDQLPDDQQGPAASADFDHFYTIATNIAMHCDIPNVDDAAITLLHYLLEHYDQSEFTPSRPTPQFLMDVEEYFGNVDVTLLKSIHQAFQRIVTTWVSDENTRIKWAEKVDSLWWGDPDDSLFPFGKVPLVGIDARLTGLEELPCPLPKLPTPVFVESGGHKDVEVTPSAAASSSSETPCCSKSLKADEPTWNEKYLRNLLDNDDLLEPTMNIIKSKMSCDEIQEQLFDLLGFDRVDLIMNLLTNRDTIKAQLERDKPDKRLVRRFRRIRRRRMKRWDRLGGLKTTNRFHSAIISRITSDNDDATLDALKSWYQTLCLAAFTFANCTTP